MCRRRLVVWVRELRGRVYVYDFFFFEGTWGSDDTYRIIYTFAVSRSGQHLELCHLSLSLAETKYMGDPTS